MLTAKDNRFYRSPASAEVEAELAALRERVAELEAALRPMVNRWEPDSDGADRRMWEAACKALRPTSSTGAGHAEG